MAFGFGAVEVVVVAVDDLLPHAGEHHRGAGQTSPQELPSIQVHSVSPSAFGWIRCPQPTLRGTRSLGEADGQQMSHRCRAVSFESSSGLEGPFRPIELLVNNVEIVGLLLKGFSVPLAAWGSHEVTAVYVDGSRVRRMSRVPFRWVHWANVGA